jgi:hypothetical protein
MNDWLHMLHRLQQLPLNLLRESNQSVFIYIVPFLQQLQYQVLNNTMKIKKNQEIN